MTRKATIRRALALLLLWSGACGRSGSPEIPASPRIYDAPPAESDPGATYVFYLHGQFIEDYGRRATHPEFGVYEYDEILRRLAEDGRIVVSEARAKDTDPKVYSDKVAGQIEALLAAGVPGRQITVIGVSKGSVIAMLVSTQIRSPEVGYVILANCNDWVTEHFLIDLHGQVLSIYEATDSVGGTCGPIFAQSKQIGTHREIRLETGLRHGFLYRPMKEWLEPAIAWTRRG
jgi:hypothetical protein